MTTYTTYTTQNATLAKPIGEIVRRSLADIPRPVIDAVLRRIVDGQVLAPKLDVAAFNSAV